jgi:hypothetical protein
MRQIDRRTQVSRRVFLRGTATAVPAAALAAAGSGISASTAWAQQAKALPPHTMATLVRMARDIYPHDFLADIYYVNAIAPWDTKAGNDAAVKAMLEGGVARLDSDAHDRFNVAYLEVIEEPDRVILLRGIETTGFFKAMRADLVVALYNQPEVWKKFGYEGSSADKGGYIHRGFDDIDWVAKV